MCEGSHVEMEMIIISTVPALLPLKLLSFLHLYISTVLTKSDWFAINIQKKHLEGHSTVKI